MSKDNKSKTNLPANNPKGQSVLLQGEMSSATIYSGPLPDPETLRQYDAVHSGAAERIIAMAEDQAMHRQKIEQIVVSAHSRNSLLGVIFAFVISLCTIIGGVYVAVNASAIAGTFFSGFGLAGLVGTFIYGTSFNNKNDVNKNKQAGEGD